MVIAQGEVWWADIGEPIGSAPGFRRPVVIVQCDAMSFLCREPGFAKRIGAQDAAFPDQLNNEPVPDRRSVRAGREIRIQRIAVQHGHGRIGWRGGLYVFSHRLGGPGGITPGRLTS